MTQLVEDIALISKFAPRELEIQAAKLSEALELARPQPLCDLLPLSKPPPP